MSAWSHLPNAAHIDRVLVSAKAYPKVWDIAWGMAYDSIAQKITWKANDAIYHANRGAAWREAHGAAYGAARSVILALIAYDDAVKYLDMPSDKLKMWAILSEDTAAILLLPAVIAFEQIGELELA